MSHVGSSCDHTTQVGNESSEYSGLKFSIWKNEDQRNENQSESSSVKWMSSKMRFMRKMMNPKNSDNQKFEDQKQESSPLQTTDHHSSYNNTIRVCSDCNTTKTPLWRSGPRGPKVLFIFNFFLFFNIF